MRNIKIILIVTLAALFAGCYQDITGTVVDAETGKPIKEAVVMVQWTKTRGFGLTYHTLYKIYETETDNEGKFAISGTYNPFVDTPVLVIYKKSYVAWRNDFVFSGFKKRTDYGTWKNKYVYKLDKLTNNAAKDKHQMFMGHGIMIDGLHDVPKFHKGMNEE